MRTSREIDAGADGLADTSVFIARESGRSLDVAALPDELAVSITRIFTSRGCETSWAAMWLDGCEPVEVGPATFHWFTRTR